MENYSYSFTTLKSSKEVYELLLSIANWWSGIYDETIRGKSHHLNDEFTFSAGGGMHFSSQKLVELITGKKIVWEVTDSQLTFLKDPREWKGTRLVFDIVESDSVTQVRFTHEGLQPQIECYGSCSTAWTKYLQNLEKTLKG